ncbi:lipid A-modifier LpxR family protein [Histidinibacterium lentulum]|uniref:lipid A-modifier LpxR family protein n=1 Tax=Histidinibacterium lentulum TaxID=2480588 RepID=UPI001FE545FC|nr:lipid A-modifier LpxR family protein [Histidinibacterium lentulum]
MGIRLVALAFALAAAASAAPAQDRVTLGFGRQFNNDLLGDGSDRWRTGSYQWSIVRGRGWAGTRPERPLDVIDFRFRSEIIAPERLNGTGSRSRLYAGLFAAGAHTHFARGPFDVSLGADLVFSGPQTGWADRQNWFHEIIDAPRVGQDGNEIENDTRIHGTLEVALPLRPSDVLIVRPFVETQGGPETLVRGGADIVLGAAMQGDLFLRDHVTGHLIRGIETGDSGFGWVAGADWTRIEDSIYLPDGGRATAEPERLRARAGVHWQFGPDMSFFYGLTYLSEEYAEQPDGQTLGSAKLNFRF